MVRLRGVSRRRTKADRPEEGEMAWILVAVFETEEEASCAQEQIAQGGASWSFLSETTDPEAMVAILERREGDEAKPEWGSLDSSRLLL